MFNVNSFDSQGNSFEVSCYDFKGNHIDHLTQWDVNQELYVEHWDYEYTPVFNFCNIKSKNALVVKGSIEPDGRAKCIIPNILLTEPYSISVFVCLENDTFGRTVHISQIPVLKKLKPNDYEYKENIEYVSWVKLEEEARAFVKELSDAVDEYEKILGTAKDNADLAALSEKAAKESEERITQIVNDFNNNSINPDFAQNNPDMKNYIKNRTHWEEIHETIYEWDGVINNSTTPPYIYRNQYFYFVGYNIPNQDELIGSQIVTSSNPNTTVTEEDITKEDNGIISLADMVLILPTYVGDFPHGVYFNRYRSEYVSKFICSRTEVHTLDDKYIPDSIARKDDIKQLDIVNLYVCSEGEYTVGGSPIIDIPDEDTIYLVPENSDGTLYSSWVYVDDAWEFVETLTISLDETECNVLTDDNKQEIAEMAAKLVKVPEVDLTGYAKTTDVPTDAHINQLINTALGVIENGTY